MTDQEMVVAIECKELLLELKDMLVESPAFTKIDTVLGKLEDILTPPDLAA